MSSIVVSFQSTEAVVIPSLRSMMSKCVGKEEQGTVLHVPYS